MDIQLTNTLTRKKEAFKPIAENKVGVYSCGPTVYWDQHIGHMYAYVHWDILVRFLRYLGNDVTWVMNITDVGHMTGDNSGDADTGEDRMEKGAKREGVSVEALADKYIAQFEDSLKLLNITKPNKLPRATKHINEQIELAKKIQERGFTYKTKMGLVFDTTKFSKYSEFARIDLEKQKSHKDLEVDPEKKKPSDFFLWVTGNPKHIMKWPSPWGVGYPGWHLECTAMSTKYLGNKFDIHTGGVEHIPVHHTNEVAQGYGAFGDITANFWLHNAWLTGKGDEKMSKSLGNYVTIQELEKKGYDPLSLRYLILNSHYRKGLKFSWESLDAAQISYNNLKKQIVAVRSEGSRRHLSQEKLQKIEKYKSDFIAALGDDLNAPKALSILWGMLKSNITSEDKYDLAISFDEVLGLRLSQMASPKYKIPQEVELLIAKREKLRSENKFEEADKKRKEILEKGFIVEDSSEGSKVTPV
ncbi:cysteine--tRNA ligase [Patescibacteria group bacterium]